MSTPITLSASPTNSSIATMTASYTDSLTVNTNNLEGKQNNITQVAVTKKIPPAHSLHADNISDREIQITSETQQFIQFNNTYATPESQIILRFLNAFGIKLQDIIVNKNGTISGYQIRLQASFNGFSVNLRMKEIEPLGLDKLTLILKSAVLSSLIDNHTSPKLAENMLVMVDATRDSYKYIIYLAVDNINISFNSIDDLINEDLFKKFVLTDNDTTLQYDAFQQLAESFEIILKKAFMDNKIDSSQYERFF
jgi:hypothetical protein